MRGRPRAGLVRALAGVAAMVVAGGLAVETARADDVALPPELAVKPGVGPRALWVQSGVVRARPDGASLLAVASTGKQRQQVLQVVGGTEELPRVLVRTSELRLLVYLGDDALATVARKGALLVAGDFVPSAPTWSTPGLRIEAGRPVELLGTAQDGRRPARFRGTIGRSADGLLAEGVVAEGAVGLSYVPEVAETRATSSALLLDGAELMDVRGRRFATVHGERQAHKLGPNRRGELLMQLDGDGFSAVGWVKQESVRLALRGKRVAYPVVFIGTVMRGRRMPLPRGTWLFGEVGGAPIGVVDKELQAPIGEGAGAGWYRYEVNTLMGALSVWARVPAESGR